VSGAGAQLPRQSPDRGIIIGDEQFHWLEFAILRVGVNIPGAQ